MPRSPRKSHASVQPDVQPDVQPAVASRQISTRGVRAADRPIPFRLSSPEEPIPFRLSARGVAYVDPGSGAHGTRADVEHGSHEEQVDASGWIS